MRTFHAWPQESRNLRRRLRVETKFNIVHLDGCFTKLCRDAAFFQEPPSSLWCSLVPSCSYRNPLCFQNAGIHKMSTLHWVQHVNERSVCAVPLPGNPVTATGAVRFLDPQLFPCPAASYPARPALITGSESIVVSDWLEPRHASSSWQTAQTWR